MGAISIIRVAILASSTLFSLIVLGLAAHLLSLTTVYLGWYFYFSALGIATSVLSLVTLPLMLLLDFNRRGAFTSMIVVELVWLSILWVLWVATAAETVAAVNVSFPLGCIYTNSIYNQYCYEMQAVEAFSFLIFILFLAYTVFLLIAALVAASGGKGVWLSSVKESTFFQSSNSPAQQLPMGQYNAPQSVPQQSVQPQYTGAPVQPQHTGSTVPSQQPYPPHGHQA